MRCGCTVRLVDRSRTVVRRSSHGEQGAADRDSEHAVGRPTNRRREQKSRRTSDQPRRHGVDELLGGDVALRLRLHQGTRSFVTMPASMQAMTAFSTLFAEGAHLLRPVELAALPQCPGPGKDGRHRVRAGRVPFEVLVVVAPHRAVGRLELVQPVRARRGPRSSCRVSRTPPRSRRRIYRRHSC